MRCIKMFAAALLLLPMLEAAHAAPSQKVISFQVDGQKVVGTLETPEGVSAPPVVLLLHGFKGSRNEMQIPSLKEGIYSRAADAWAAKGIASLRIDFRGGGDSDGSFEDTTISGQIKDALAAVDFLQTEKSVDPTKLALVGWSQGGAVAATVAGRTTHPIKAVALWNPLSAPAATIETFLGVDRVQAGLASGGKPITVKLPWGAEVALKTAYFEDIFTIDPVAELAKYPGPVFVAVGTKDTIVYPQPQSGQLLLTYHKGPGELWVRPMDHGFNVFDETKTVDELIAATGAFVAKNVN
ncbi:S9 family peptidase [Methylocapsa sp. S129]|uniref:alpha/beta hydrolase family protein n=1 Tax=Methylocapsa sp. S129 TaxID=1641869 RepID=UPI00131E6349|nr:alpha/beta fold hydrolase [Methylocapsa sp. S129]